MVDVHLDPIERNRILIAAGLLSTHGYADQASDLIGIVDSRTPVTPCHSRTFAFGTFLRCVSPIGHDGHHTAVSVTGNVHAVWGGDDDAAPATSTTDGDPAAGAS